MFQFLSLCSFHPLCLCVCSSYSSISILPIFESWDVTFSRKSFLITSTTNETCGHVYYDTYTLNFTIVICAQSLSLSLDYNFRDSSD